MKNSVIVWLNMHLMFVGASAYASAPRQQMPSLHHMPKEYQYDAYKRDGMYEIKVKHNDKTIADVQYKVCRDEHALVRLYVRPEYRKNKIGTGLLQAAQEHLWFLDKHKDIYLVACPLTFSEDVSVVEQLVPLDYLVASYTKRGAVFLEQLSENEVRMKFPAKKV